MCVSEVGFASKIGYRCEGESWRREESGGWGWVSGRERERDLFFRGLDPPSGVNRDQAIAQWRLLLRSLVQASAKLSKLHAQGGREEGGLSAVRVSADGGKGGGKERLAGGRPGNARATMEGMWSSSHARAAAVWKQVQTGASVEAASKVHSFRSLLSKRPCLPEALLRLLACLLRPCDPPLLFHPSHSTSQHLDSTHTTSQHFDPAYSTSQHLSIACFLLLSTLTTRQRVACGSIQYRAC